MRRKWLNFQDTQKPADKSQEEEISDMRRIAMGSYYLTEVKSSLGSSFSRLLSKNPGFQVNGRFFWIWKFPRA
jgi:hypothetical protein